ncbi:Hsp20/alpha crystallin family protein [Thermaerobacillus caldiproteolyticus]|uniref:HSP20 family molecular chaperone IbpA n=1 Tax=Thermaerobacillus caldiproteolyticus TaxID=247480 RepID=A0A7V9Z6U6_9BACL|nr:Hsp20/alpha crystallin family protein [Anoxybacillus caldiproteolyticus]MBA2875084.1 HSP20 family molecular chaperone IbpA [Anoxybacillus caldiproteolyticus]QPA32940.1 Hsp20/alpha crystallin family protein [Anoxybacillus caldiproteolyticus]
MNDHFQPPMKKKQDDEPFQRLWGMIDQFFDERPLKKMFETLDEYFHKTFSHAYIPVEVHETKHDYTITAHLPHVKRDQIQLEFTDDYLHLTVKNHEIIESTDEGNHVYQKRQMSQNITRTIPLPYPVTEKEIKASFEDGRLIIRLPQKRKYIDID